MKAFVTGLAGIELGRKAVLVKGASPPGTVWIAVQIQGNLYEIVTPGHSPPAISRMEGLSSSEATKITASGYDCIMYGPVGALSGPEPAAGEGGCGRGD